MLSATATGSTVSCSSVAVSASVIACVGCLLTTILSLNIAELVIGTRYLEDSTNTCHQARAVAHVGWDHRLH